MEMVEEREGDENFPEEPRGRTEDETVDVDEQAQSLERRGEKEGAGDKLVETAGGSEEKDLPGIDRGDVTMGVVYENVPRMEIGGDNGGRMEVEEYKDNSEGSEPDSRKR